MVIVDHTTAANARMIKADSKIRRTGGRVKQKVYCM